MTKFACLLAAVAGLFSLNTPAYALGHVPRYSTAELCQILLPCLPPARFTRGPFVEPPVVDRVPLATVQSACSNGEGVVLNPKSKEAHKLQLELGDFGGGAPSIMGCAELTGTQCIVHVPSDVQKSIPELYNIVLTHELGHCRGWVHPRY